MKRAGDELRGHRTGHDTEEDRILEAEAERLEEALDPEESMLDDPETRDHVVRLRMIQKLDRLAERSRELDAMLEAIAEAIRRIS